MQNKSFFAVASKDGISINLHFGHATSFWIYQVSSEGVSFLEQREVEHYCNGNTSSQSAMENILKTIHDCDAVFVAKIGDGPRNKLSKINVVGIDAYAYEAIDASLENYLHKKMIHSEWSLSILTNG